MHKNILKLEEFQSWRRGADTEMMAPAEIGKLIDWAIKVCRVADGYVTSAPAGSGVWWRRLESVIKRED